MHSWLAGDEYRMATAFARASPYRAQLDTETGVFESFGELMIGPR